MGRVKANANQEIISSDISDIAPYLQQEIYDRLIYELMGRKTDAFFGASFQPARVNATTVSLQAGLAFFSDSSQTGVEPKKRPIYASASFNATITAAHATLNRYDIICLAPGLAGTTETRKYKDPDTSVISDVSFTIKQDWSYTLSVVAGTAGASPAVPSTPAGYIKVADVLVTAAVGVSAAADVKDKRNYLPVASDSVAETAFTIANNQGANADVTGLAVDSAFYRSMVIEVDILRKTDTASSELRGFDRVYLAWNSQSSAWVVQGVYTMGDDCGIIWAVSTSATRGQLQYTSTNIAGSNYVGNTRIRARSFNV